MQDRTPKHSYHGAVPRAGFARIMDAIVVVSKALAHILDQWMFA